MSNAPIIPRRPYLLRAMHQWMTDNGFTPHVMVDVSVSGVDVPKAHVREGRIVLNIDYEATRHLDLGNEMVSFEARFGGVARTVCFPVAAVHSIYARETGEGLIFAAEDSEAKDSEAEDTQAEASASDDSPFDATVGKAPAPRGRPTLKIVK